MRVTFAKSTHTETQELRRWCRLFADREATVSVGRGSVGIADTGRESGRGNIDTNDPKKTFEVDKQSRRFV